MSLAATELVGTEHASLEPRALAAAASEPVHELITVIIPVYNEAATIDELLHKVLAAPYRKQIVVVDDGSTDGTTALLEKWQGEAEVELVRHPTNRGKGASIRTALPHARGRFTIIQDADLEYDPQDYARLLEPLLKGKAEVVYGSRYAGSAGASPSRRASLSHWLFRWGVRMLNLCVRCWYGVRLTDEATCYKMIPTSLLRAMNLQCERFEFCPEVTAKASRMGLRILEVPIHYHPRTIEAGKKIRWKDGLQAIATLWKWRRWHAPRPRSPRASAWPTEKQLDAEFVPTPVFRLQAPGGV